MEWIHRVRRSGAPTGVIEVTREVRSKGGSERARNSTEVGQLMVEQADDVTAGVGWN